MNNIFYLKGDATKPGFTVKEGNRVIVHICNDIGAWGKGFVLALEKEYPIAKTHYKYWYNNHSNKKLQLTPFKLGEVQIVPVNTKINGTIYVANMIAQHGIKKRHFQKVPPIRYEALIECLKKVKEFTEIIEFPTIHMPKIGCGLAGGKWHKIVNIIEEILTNIPVYVYNLNGQINEN